MPKNWKYIKKLLEKEFLCEKLRGHITYDLTDYKPAPWYQQHFIMKYDDEVLLEIFQPRLSADKRYHHYDATWTYDRRIIEQVSKKYNLDKSWVNGQHITSIFQEVIDGVRKVSYHDAGIYGVNDIIDLLGVYLHSNIDSCFEYGQDPFIEALAILDRRCGKRRLQKYAKNCWWGVPTWLRRIYQIRFEAEDINYNEEYGKPKKINYDD